jgi:hypothetical protein
MIPAATNEISVQSAFSLRLPALPSLEFMRLSKSPKGFLQLDWQTSRTGTRAIRLGRLLIHICHG